MKKIALTLILLVAISFAADASYLKGFPILNDSTWIKKGDVHYTSHYIDTMTIHARYGDTILDFTTSIYNARMKSVNVATTDSGAILISLGRGIWHDDTVSKNLSWRAVGGTGNAAPDTVSYLYFGSIGLRYLTCRPVVRTGGGVNCSTTIIRVEGWR